MAIRIALVDDHRIFREGIRALFSALPDLEVVADASTAATAREAIAAANPEVVVLDLALPDAPGVQLIQEVANNRSVRVLVLSMHHAEARVREAFEAGATGYALKDQPASEVAEAIRVVHRGGVYLAPSLPRETVSSAHRAPSSSARKLASLSLREREVFNLLVQGSSNKEVSATLGISVKTVETHRMSINRKLDLHSTAELVRFAAIQGLLMD